MLDTGQPGELSLMRELIALKKARSLQDPCTVESLGFENAVAPSNSSRKLASSRGLAGRSSETGKTGSGRGPHFFAGGQGVSSSHSRRISRKIGLPAPKSSPTKANDDDMHAGWNLDLQGTLLGEERHQQQAVFGDLSRKNSPNSGDEFSRRLSGDANDDDYSLQNWTKVRRAQEESELAQMRPAEQAQTQNEGERVSKAFPVTKEGEPSQDISASFEFKNYAGAKKSPFPGRKGSNLRKDAIAKQNAQILSPLTLNSHDDSFYAGGQQLTLFSLEGPLHDEQEPWKQEVKVGPSRVFGSASRSVSPLSKDRISQVELASTTKKTEWVPPHDSLSSSSHTSQRTLSRVSLPGAWEASLDDELEVSELPQNGCGMPRQWTKGKRRSKGVMKNPKDPLRRKGGTSPKAPLRSHKETGVVYKADDLRKPSAMKEKETAPLLMDPSAPLLTGPSAVTDSGGMSSSDGLMRKSGDMSAFGSLPHIRKDASNKPGASKRKEIFADSSTSDGKELAFFVERPRSLCQKYRPKTFEELVGQNLVTHALSNAIARGKVAPVYLFQGSRGTGKTSAARIFAAALNCVSTSGRKPCGFCSECNALASGNALDIQEIDASSHSSLESVKALLQTTFMAASGSRYKIFIVDECHMLTSETWTSLLKLLDEPPRNVVVILMTSDAGKLPRAAVSRCLKFLFPKIKHADIVSRLENLVRMEKLDVEPGALDLIASKSEGSIRDAEMVLDQLSLLGQRITIGTIHELVGSVSDDKLLSLLDLALSADTSSTVRRARELIDSGIEPLDLMSQLATLITDILAGSYEIMNREQNGGFFSRHALSEAEMERLRIALEILAEAEKQLRGASKDRTTWLTVALLRFGPDRPSKLPLSFTSASLTPSPVYHQSMRTSKKFNDSKAASRSKKEIKRKLLPRRMSAAAERRSNDSGFKGAGRRLKPGYEVRVHPTDASREFSTESSVAESPFSSERDQRHTSFQSPGNMRSIWLNVLEACGSIPLRQLLQYHGKLLAMSFSAVDAVAHLEFTKPEYKQRAERCRRNIAKAFKKVLGLSVEVKISLASLPFSMGLPPSRMWTPGIAKQRRVQTTSKQYINQSRSESDEVDIDGNDPEVGSFRQWKPQGGGLFNQKSRHSFPAIPMYSAGVMEPQPMSSRQNRMYGPLLSRFGPEAPMHDGHQLETTWVEEGRNYSSSQFFQNPRQNHRFLKDVGGESHHHDLPSTNLSYTRNEFNKAPVGLYAQKYGHGLSKYRDSAASEYVSIGENMKLESKLKYGGLLCWKAPKAERQNKATKQRGRRKPGILIRLVPCVKSKSPR